MSARVALAQFNSCVGCFDGNIESMRRLIRQALPLKTDIIVFPELCVCGYPPEDLLLKRHFLLDSRQAVEKLAQESGNITIILGFPEVDTDNICFNSLAALQDKKVVKIYRKCLLPNYGVFDERRYFHAGSEPAIITVNNIAIALTICEDIWNLKALDKSLSRSPKPDLIINISASPFHVGKIIDRQRILSDCAVHFGCAMAYCNLIGGQDELVFDGRSMFVDPDGQIVCQSRAFEEDIIVADISVNTAGEKIVQYTGPAESNLAGHKTDPVAEVYAALVSGTRDYVRKNGFEKVIIGLSGGVDSALVAAIAVDAVGAENVIGVTMPTKFNSPETISDAGKLADRLGIEFHTIPVESVLAEFNTTLSDIAGWNTETIAYENLQARIRGCILMSLSNRFSYLVLTTGNKSETAVGYCTLYGDTAGGFAVIKDVPKTMVWQLCQYINKVKGKEVIPQSIIERIPSAELRTNQKDTDCLPDYDLLDRILKGYIEQDKSLQQLIDEGLPADIVRKVICMADRNEYKRRQSPPGIKITPKSFGRDRRMPITNLYR